MARVMEHVEVAVVAAQGVACKCVVEGAKEVAKVRVTVDAIIPVRVVVLVVAQDLHMHRHGK